MNPLRRLDRNLAELAHLEASLANRRKANGQAFAIDDFMRWGIPPDEDDIATPEKFSALVRRRGVN